MIFKYIYHVTNRKVFNSSSGHDNSRWSFDPRKGLSLKNPTVYDTAFYYFAVSMPSTVNGRRANIQHDEENKRLFDLFHFRPDQINATGLSPRILLVVEGNSNFVHLPVKYS
jgi:hypothetical protein